MIHDLPVVIGSALSHLFGIPSGFWQTAVGSIVEGIFLAIAPVSMWLYCYYAIALKNSSNKDKEGNTFRKIRGALENGNGPQLYYINRLWDFVNWSDRFFKDKSSSQQSAFGLLQSPAPLWTSGSFDRCLLLAIVYPIGSLIVGWLIYPHQGTAELALNLNPHVNIAKRILFVSTSVALVIASRWFFRTRHLWNLERFAFAIVVFVIATLCSWPFANSLAGAVAFSTVLTGIAGVSIYTIKNDGVLAVAFCTLTIWFNALLFVVVGSNLLAVAVALGITVICMTMLARLASVLWMRKKELFFVILAYVMLVFVVMSTPLIFSRYPIAGRANPLMLFFGLLTLINAPFDWVSIGLTRTLIRIGLEKQGLWPFVLGILDTAIATVLIIVLALGMTIALQAFDDIALLSAGVPVLNVRQTLEMLRVPPNSPAVLWIYLTLFSTLFPSGVNLFLGCLSLIRGAPGLNRWMLNRMPESGMNDPNIHLLPPILMLQWVGSCIFAGVIIIVAFLALIWWEIPKVGKGLVELCYDVVDADYPRQLWDFIYQRLHN